MLGNLSQTSLLVAPSTRIVILVCIVAGAVVRHALLLLNHGLACSCAQRLHTVSVLERLNERTICLHRELCLVMAQGRHVVVVITVDAR